MISSHNIIHKSKKTNNFFYIKGVKFSFGNLFFNCWYTALPGLHKSTNHMCICIFSGFGDFFYFFDFLLHPIAIKMANIIYFLYFQKCKRMQKAKEYKKVLQDYWFWKKCSLPKGMVDYLKKSKCHIIIFLCGSFIWWKDFYGTYFMYLLVIIINIIILAFLLKKY